MREIPLDKPVWILRHGESEDHRSGVVSSELARARDDYALTEEGALEVGRAITREPRLRSGRVAIIGCPSLRAAESAQIAGEILGVRVGADERLRERGFGSYEEGAIEELSEIWELDQTDPSHTHRDVESVEAVAERAIEALESAQRWHGFDQVLLVSHGEVLGILRAALEGELGDHHSRCPFLAELSLLGEPNPKLSS